MTAGDQEPRRGPGRRDRHLVGLTFAALALVVLALGGCGLTLDDDPRALDIGETTTTAATSPTAGRFATVLYFVRDGTLLPVQSELPDRRFESAVSALAQPPTGDVPVSGLGTSIPTGTEVLAIARAGEQFTVDLSSAFDNVVGLTRQQAIGQIVMTVTQQVPDATLSFQVDGRTLTVSSPARGDRTVVDACDYASLLAGADEALTLGLGGAALDDLTLRKAALSEQCAG